MAASTASNPCSEYMFLDDTACNLASLNLMHFLEQRPRHRAGHPGLPPRHAACGPLVLEISVAMAQYPSEEIAMRSYLYRTLGLGYANLGALLMQLGIPYDSPKGYALCGAITAIMTGGAYATSAEIASELGAFKRYEANREPMLRVIRNHRRAAYNAARLRVRGPDSQARRHLSRQLPRPDCWQQPKRPGTRRWKRARSPATATPRSR